MKFNSLHVVTTASLLFLTPVAALAGSAWSTVTVEQNQHVAGAKADLIQTADVVSTVKFGDQAYVQSNAWGSQALWIDGKGGQKQKLSTEAGLQWEDNAWPAEATAHTKTSVGQWQHGWGPAKAVQEAGILEKSRVGDAESRNEATIKQKTTTNGGDFSQDQTLKGKTHADGFIDPPWFKHCDWTCSGNNNWFGGKLITDVSVFVRNVFEF